ncbi:DUF1338 domain-containing protein [Arenibacter sp. S6351L]|uniref:DUF1338 domain-containing protein n=1 Tax=Arenibacter sp. S6351L TaxID=2926407 RepID=UPI001FF2133D|nr:DUF1338 domain-containing protein [Arenibacter sp. S6351L]MCK0136034.1 DUF1338 domain-containing protein [Arenibacter sp. S6351L]
METKRKRAFDTILQALFTPYRELVPDVQKISKAMISHGIIQDENEIVNDHIAFRTLGIPNLGINSFEKIFLHYGYQKRDYYYFEGKKLDAYWYAPPEDHYPRIFMSELRVSELSEEAQHIIKKYTQDITSDPVDHIDLDDTKEVGQFFYKPLWKIPSLADYNTLADESEYAAWVIYNRYYLNHYTISVHDLPNAYNTIEKFNVFLESIDIKLNTSGGKIKTSEDGLLKQSSTIAKMVAAEFMDSEKAEIAGSYVEFAERLPLPSYLDRKIKTFSRQQRRDGFESANADKIFESTYREQTKNV